MPFKVTTWYYRPDRTDTLRKSPIVRAYRDAEAAGMYVQAIMESPPGKCARAQVDRISEAEYVRLGRGKI